MISVVIAGRIGKDAETRQAGKDNVTSFSIASDSKRGQEKTTIWIDASIWGNRGTALAPYLKKGQAVTVMGELTTREHQGKTYLGCKVDHIELQGGSKSGGSNSPATPAPSRTIPETGNSGDGSDDIPF